MPDFKKIKADYIRGGISYRQLAEKYGVSLSSITRRATKDKWADLRKQREKKANTEIVEKVAQQEAKRVDMIQDVADLLLQRIKEGVDDRSLLTDSQSIRQITASIKDLRDIKGCKSELDMQEQIARIEKLRREAQADAPTDTSIEIRIGNADEYAE